MKQRYKTYKGASVAPSGRLKPKSKRLKTKSKRKMHGRVSKPSFGDSLNKISNNIPLIGMPFHIVNKTILESDERELERIIKRFKDIEQDITLRRNKAKGRKWGKTQRALVQVQDFQNVATHRLYQIRKKEKERAHSQIKIYEMATSNPEKYLTWSKEDLQNRISDILRVQAELTGSIRKAADFNLSFFQALLDTNRPIDLKLIDDSGYFHWPDTLARAEGGGESLFFDDFQEEGVLSTLGYNAQLDGPEKTKRRQILDKLFTGEVNLPKNLPADYHVSWGEPQTSTRLRKIANTLASFCRQQKNRQNPSVQAIHKWEQDLAYLRETYYKPFRRKFAWPSS